MNVLYPIETTYDSIRKMLWKDYPGIEITKDTAVSGTQEELNHILTGKSPFFIVFQKKGIAFPYSGENEEGIPFYIRDIQHDKLTAIGLEFHIGSVLVTDVLDIPENLLRLKGYASREEFIRIMSVREKRNITLDDYCSVYFIKEMYRQEWN